MKYDKKAFIVRNRERMTDRSFLIDTFTCVKNRLRFANETEAVRKITNGDYVILPSTIIEIEDGKVIHYAYTSKHEVDNVEISYISLHTGHDAPINITDVMEITKGDIDNLNSKVKTTMGRYLMNQVLLVHVFGSKLEYINTQFGNGDIEKHIVDWYLKKEITADDVYAYTDCLYFLGHFTELCVPTFTKKSFMTDPDMAKFKKGLLAKYKDQLDDPVILAKIEDEMIAKDKAFLKGDTNTRFYDAMGKKTYNIHRKKMFLSVGAIEAFSEDESKTVFIENSLSEGWDVENFDLIVDEIRKGCYSRGAETAKGGDLTKYIMRIFQDVELRKGDCKSKNGYKYDVTAGNYMDFVGRTDMTGRVMTEGLMKGLVGRSVKLRSVMTCKLKGGVCHTCMGTNVSKLEHKTVLGMAIEITGLLMGLSMKNMHGTKLSTQLVTSLDAWVY